MTIEEAEMETMVQKADAYDDFVKWYKEVGHSTGLSHLRSAVEELVDKMEPHED